MATATPCARFSEKTPIGRFETIQMPSYPQRLLISVLKKD
jgi:hypothetical protein